MDGSYNGTNQAVGFPQSNPRQNGMFATYPLGYGQGTTGGRGALVGDVYECETGEQILSALEQIKTKQAKNALLKSIIKITANITQDNTPYQTSIKTCPIIPNGINNLSIIGANENAIFNGVGINFKSCNNVIVQNLTFYHPSQRDKNEKDCLEFNNCNGVWVDHCELYNDYPSNTAEKDFYDGLIDVKNQSSRVTVSYNYLHDAFKSSLVGSGTGDIWEDRTITYHHNIFENLNSRVPAIRSGYGHIYNNYYKGIKSSGANCRIEADVFIEGNIFEDSKNPVCALEDSVKGFYNIAPSNVFTNCVGVPSSSTTDFTPSYSYFLDDTTDLKTYLSQTVGVNKVNVETQCADDEGYKQKYEIAKNLLIDRAIAELSAVSLTNECAQKLAFIAKEILFADNAVVTKLTRLEDINQKAEQYISLYVSDLISKINAVDFDNNFARNATAYLAVKARFDRLTDQTKSLITNAQTLETLSADYALNLVQKFNAQVTSLQSATESDMPDVESLLQIYQTAGEQEKSQLDYSGLQNAYISSQAHIIAREFETLCNALPSQEQVDHSCAKVVLDAVKKYNELTEKQFSFVSAQAVQKFNDVYSALISQSRTMDVSGITVKKIATESQVAGDVSLSINMEVLKGADMQTFVGQTEVAFGGKTYSSCAYISGYGNRGSKSVWFAVYSNSTVKVVLSSQSGPCRFTVADAQGNVLNVLSVDTTAVTQLEITDLEVGEYRFYTTMPNLDEFPIYTDSKAYVYGFEIVPNN